MNENNDRQRSEQSKAIHDSAELFARLLRKSRNGNLKPTSQIWAEVEAMVQQLDGLKGQVLPRAPATSGHKVEAIAQALWELSTPHVGHPDQWDQIVDDYERDYFLDKAKEALDWAGAFDGGDALATSITPRGMSTPDDPANDTSGWDR